MSPSSTMLSTIRRAWTPGKDPSNMSINTSPAPSSLLLRHYSPSPPPFSPITESQQNPSPSPAQQQNGNNIMMTEQLDLPMDLASDQDSSDREQEATDDSLLSPTRAGNPTSESRDGTSLLDVASNGHLQPLLEGVQASGTFQANGSLPPSTEPVQIYKQVSANSAKPYAWFPPRRTERKD